MRVYEIFSYNLKQILFKDDLDYLEGLLNGLGLTYGGLAFCFDSDADGVNTEKVIKQFPSLAKYKHFARLSDDLSPQVCLTSAYFDESGNRRLYVDPDHTCDFRALLKKIPRPINYGFMGVVMDLIDWSGDGAADPSWKNEKLPGDSFYNYFSNSIRFFKAFDYGTKLNLVRVMVDRTGEGGELSPYPEKLCALLGALGKPYNRRFKCVFDAEESARIEKANEKFKDLISREPRRGNFDDFVKEAPISEELIPLCGFSVKQALGRSAKGLGYKYGGLHCYCYEFSKVDSHGHKLTAEFFQEAFSSRLSADLCICGCNFDLTVTGFPQVIVKTEEEVSHYAERVFECIPYFEDRYTEELFLAFGATPTWYFKEK